MTVSHVIIAANSLTDGDFMQTILKNENDADTFDLASEILRKGGLVAFPTETVYGLGGDALQKDASKKIYAAKGRPSDNPLIVHIADRDALNVLAAEIPEKAWILAEAFWPGPLTIILKKKCIVPDETTGGLDTVASRSAETDKGKRDLYRRSIRKYLRQALTDYGSTCHGGYERTH